MATGREGQRRGGKAGEGRAESGGHGRGGAVTQRRGEQSFCDHPDYEPYPGLMYSLTRDSDVTVTTDTRGNLGPPSVMAQEAPGADWLKDRWQAASDMGGTAIPGQHWVLIDMGREVVAWLAVLDWEAAYANRYKVLVRTSPPPPGDGASEAGWHVAFDGDKPAAEVPEAQRRENLWGQSPGVSIKRAKQATPLHRVHTVTLEDPSTGDSSVAFRFLKLLIVKPASGWGVSLWQVDLLPP